MKLTALLLAMVLASGSEQNRGQICGGPRAHWMKPACLQSCALAPLINVIAVDSSDHILWNGAVTTEARLAKYLRQSAKLVPRPTAFFQNGAGSRCGAAERIRRLMDQNLPCASDGPCGEGDLSTWERTPATSGTMVS